MTVIHLVLICGMTAAPTELPAADLSVEAYHVELSALARQMSGDLLAVWVAAPAAPEAKLRAIRESEDFRECTSPKGDRTAESRVKACQKVRAMVVDLDIVDPRGSEERMGALRASGLRMKDFVNEQAIKGRRDLAGQAMTMLGRLLSDLSGQTKQFGQEVEKACAGQEAAAGTICFVDRTIAWKDPGNPAGWAQKVLGPWRAGTAAATAEFLKEVDAYTDAPASTIRVGPVAVFRSALSTRVRDLVALLQKSAPAGSAATLAQMRAVRGTKEFKECTSPKPPASAAGRTEACEMAAARAESIFRDDRRIFDPDRSSVVEPAFRAMAEFAYEQETPGRYEQVRKAMTLVQMAALRLQREIEAIPFALYYGCSDDGAEGARCRVEWLTMFVDPSKPKGLDKMIIGPWRKETETDTAAFLRQLGKFDDTVANR